MMMIKVKYVYETAYQKCTEEVENEGKKWNSHRYHLRYMQEKRNKQRRKISESKKNKKSGMAEIKEEVAERNQFN